MQCCKPAIRQEGNSCPPRPGTCPAHFGQGVHEAIFCPFLLSTLEWFKRALSPIQIGFTTKLVKQTRRSNSSKSVNIIHYFEDWKTSYFNFNFNFNLSLPYFIILWHRQMTISQVLHDLFGVVYILRQWFTTLCHSLHPFSASLTKYLSFSTFPIARQRGS